ncbi:MAG: GHMP kinase [Chloroflexi bacterium]|nr:GHMP kinase [Chloroflexota bacterium]
MTQTANFTRTATMRAPGSCGELAQGMVDGDYFLVSCPIDMHSTATVTLTPGDGRVDAPPDAPKSQQAVKLTLAHFGHDDVDARLRLSSQLPRGKGMASSTADVSAAIATTAAALGAENDLSPTTIGEIALQVEPSDSIMLPGIAALDHKRGNIAETLGEPPAMRVVALDFGGVVDTLAFNGVNREGVLKRMQPECEEALSLIRRGICKGSAAEIGAGATLSAIANQRLLYKPQLDAALRLAREVGAVGVNAAHSGTMLGMLFDDDELAENAVSRAWETLFGIHRIYNRRIVSGGVIPVETYNRPEEATLWRR